MGVKVHDDSITYEQMEILTSRCAGEILRKYQGFSYSYTDIRNEAHLVALELLPKYDKSRSSLFSYLWLHTMYAMRKIYHRKKLKEKIGVSTFKRVAICSSEVQEGILTPTADCQEQLDAKLSLEKLVDQVTNKGDKDVLMLLLQDYKGFEIAKELGVTKQRVSQRIMSIRKILREITG